MTEARPYDWTRILQPGERVLWQGGPGESAGWGCMMRARGAGDVVLAALTVPLAILVAVLGGGSAAAVVVVLSLLVRTLRVTLAAWRLGHAAYVVTDRRSMRVHGLLGPTHLATIDHDDMQPHVVHGACGQTIYLGEARGSRFGAPLPLQEAKTGAGMMQIRSMPGQNLQFDSLVRLLMDDSVTLRALDPRTSPLRLLQTIARGRIAEVVPDGRTWL